MRLKMNDCYLSMRRKKASVVIFTIWALIFLSVFSIGIGRNVSAGLNFSSHIQKRLKAHYLALGGIYLGIDEAEKDETPDYDSLKEEWANNKELFEDRQAGEGYISLSYSLHPGSNENEAITLYGVEDETSRININKAPLAVLKSLFENVAGVQEEEADEIANSIIDWRDLEGVVSPGGAENEYYQDLDEPYPCKNRDFEVIEELLLVKGVTPEMFTKIKDIITVYGDGKVNINTAGKLTLIGLGFDEDFVDKLVEFRGDGETGDPEGDNVFKTVAGIREVGFLFVKESQDINRLISSGVLSVATDTFRITSAGVFKDETRRFQKRISCVVKLQEDKDPEILYWNEQ